MAFKLSSSKENIKQIAEKVDTQDKKIDEQISITRLFIIIVAVTLVLTLTATLVGLGGLYLSAFKNDDSQVVIIENQFKELVTEIKNLRENLTQTGQEIQLLKARNSYLK